MFLKLVRDDALRIGIGIEFHSLGAVYEYEDKHFLNAIKLKNFWQSLHIHLRDLVTHTLLFWRFLEN